MPIHFLDPTENGYQAASRACSRSGSNHRSGWKRSGWGKAEASRCNVRFWVPTIVYEEASLVFAMSFGVGVRG